MQINLIFTRKVFHAISLVLKVKAFGTRNSEMAYWFILSLSLNEKVYGDWVQLRLWPTRAPRTSKLRSDVLTAGFILEIGQWESNGPPSVILGGPFSKKSGTRKGAPNPNTLHECFLRLLTFYMGRTRRMLCRHFGTFWATEKASARIILQNPGCLSGEMMTQKKRRKAIATVRGYKSSK